MCAAPPRISSRRYIYAGGYPYELTEGDLLAVFSQVRARQPSLRVARLNHALQTLHMLFARAV